MELYTYSVRNNGRLIFSSKPMPEEQAMIEAAKYSEVEIEEYEFWHDGIVEFDHQD